jgi:hypothetical protein
LAGVGPEDRPPMGAGRLFPSFHLKMHEKGGNFCIFRLKIAEKEDKTDLQLLVGRPGASHRLSLPRRVGCIRRARCSHHYCYYCCIIIVLLLLLCFLVLLLLLCYYYYCVIIIIIVIIYILLLLYIASVEHAVYIIIVIIVIDIGMYMCYCSYCLLLYIIIVYIVIIIRRFGLIASNGASSGGLRVSLLGIDQHSNDDQVHAADVPDDLEDYHGLERAHPIIASKQSQNGPTQTAADC